MNNFDISILDFSNCWLFDRYIPDDFQAVVNTEEIEFTGFDSYGIYQDFELLNQQLPGYAALRLRFVTKCAPILC